MRKLIYFLLLIFMVSNLTAQENDKQYIEIVGEFNPVNGIIEKIENTGENTNIIIKVKNKTSNIVLINSDLNESFISYVEIEDMINIKMNNNENKIAIFKKQGETVKVRIFYIKE